MNRAPQSIEFWDRLVKERLPEAMPDVRGEQLEGLGRWAGSDNRYLCLQRILELAIGSVQAYDVGKFGPVKVAGHDMENNAHVCYQVLRMVHGREEKLGAYVVWELAVAAVVHNWGRWLGHGDDIHQKTGALLVAELTEQLYRPRSGEEQLCFARVVNHVLEHSGKNTGDPVGDLVRASDRFQQVAPLGPFRYLLNDVGRTDVPILPPLAAELRGRVPLAVAESSWLAWVEFMARNLFSFRDPEANGQNPTVYVEIMDENQREANRRRALSVAALMVVTGYRHDKSVEEQPPLAQQVFAPELHLAPADAHWSKRKLPDELMAAAVQALGAYPSLQPKAEPAFGEVVDALRATHSYVDEAELGGVQRRFAEMDRSGQLAFLRGLRFCRAAYGDELDRERRLTREAAESADATVRALAGYVASYLAKKPASVTAFR